MVIIKIVMLESPAALYTQTKTPCLACPVLTLRQASCLSLSQTSAETGMASKRETVEIYDDKWWIETT